MTPFAQRYNVGRSLLSEPVVSDVMQDEVVRARLEATVAKFANAPLHERMPVKACLEVMVVIVVSNGSGLFVEDLRISHDLAPSELVNFANEQSQNITKSSDVNRVDLDERPVFIAPE